jgi:hypothetical protein
MSCTKCNNGNIIPNCGCDKSCNTPINCGCRISTGAECITMNKDLECSNITKGKKLEDVLIEMDAYLCELLTAIEGVGSFSIANVGDQAEVFKGISGTGIRQFRTIQSLSENITVTQEEDTIDLDFNITFPDPTGVETVENACEDGTSIIDSYTNNTLTLRGIKSDTIEVKEENGCIAINFPPPDIQDGIPRYIVNNLYTGDEELGTTGKPFKTIAAAVTAFLGGGSPDAPVNQGAFITIQKGNTYTHNGNFSYRNLNVILEEGAIVNCNPGIGNFAVDYDALNNTTATFSLEVRAGARLNLTQKGFRNQGSTGGAAQPKRILISGAPSGEVRLSGAHSAGYVMFDINSADNTGYNMPAVTNIAISNVRIFSVLKNIWTVGRDGIMTISGCNIRHANTSDVIDPTQKVFYQSGGSITLTDATYSLNGTEREGAFYLNKDSAFGCVLIILGGRILFSQKIDALFVNESATQDATLECKNLVSVNTNIIELFESQKLWVGVDFDKNILTGNIDSTKVDLTKNNTRSCINTVNNIVVQSLRWFNNRDAASAVLPRGAAFINRDSSANHCDWYYDIVMQEGVTCTV